MMECCAGQYHGNLICPLRLISPAHRIVFPNMRTTRESNNSVGKFTPNLKTEVQFVSGKHDDVIVDGKYGFGFNLLVRIEAIR